MITHPPISPLHRSLLACARRKPPHHRPSIATAAIDAGRRALRRAGPGGARPPGTHHGGPRRPPPLRPQRHPLPHRAAAAVKSVHAFDRAMLDSMRSPWAERRRVEVSCISAADTKPENLVGLRLHSDEPCAWWCRRWMQLVKCVWPWRWSPPPPRIGSGSRLGATAAGIALVPWFVLSLPLSEIGFKNIIYTAILSVRCF